VAECIEWDSTASNATASCCLLPHTPQRAMQRLTAMPQQVLQIQGQWGQVGEEEWAMISNAGGQPILVPQYAV
jgi:hypothetical protein